MFDILIKVSPFFGLVALGYFIKQKQVISVTGQQYLTRFIMYVSLPAVLLEKLATTEFKMLLDFKFLGAYILSLFVLLILSGLVGFLVFERKTSHGIMIGLSSVYANIGFLGIPVLAVSVGEWTSIPLALMLTIDLVILLPLASLLLQLTTEQNVDNTHRPVEILIRSLLNPLIISIIVGLCISALRVNVGESITEGLKFIGNTAGPCAMFIVGTSLVGRKISAKPYEAGLISVFKLCIAPFIVFMVMTGFNVSPAWIMAATLGAAMPCAAVLGVVAEEYKVMPFQASTAVVLTTLCAAGTLPVLIHYYPG
ncbi:AEC family transporter [Kiloniella sp.]|uniref:AEC family transporter n=1 Tax=Kiloniella sp. TaxID=1938587 RepID=UPI003A938B87